MLRRVQKWGNSLAVRIPRVLAEEIGLRPDAPVDLSLVKGRLILEPVQEQTFTLDQLLAQVTRDNLHNEVETGPPSGNEIW